jgi:hypothetical protein
MNLRQQHQERKRQAIRKAIDALSGDHAYNNLECVILSKERFPELVLEYMWEAVAEGQEAWLSKIGESAVAYLQEKLNRMEHVG